MPLRINVNIDGQYPAIMFMMEIMIPIIESPTAPVQPQPLPLKRPYAMNRAAMPSARIIEPQTAANCATSATATGRFTEKADERKDAKTSESMPLKMANMPFITMMISRKSMPAGFSRSIPWYRRLTAYLSGLQDNEVLPIRVVLLLSYRVRKKR